MFLMFGAKNPPPAYFPLLRLGRDGIGVSCQVKQLPAGEEPLGVGVIPGRDHR